MVRYFFLFPIKLDLLEKNLPNFSHRQNVKNLSCRFFYCHLHSVPPFSKIKYRTHMVAMYVRFVYMAKPVSQYSSIVVYKTLIIYCVNSNCNKHDPCANYVIPKVPRLVVKKEKNKVDKKQWK